MCIFGKMDRNDPVNIDVLCVAGDKRRDRAGNCRCFRSKQQRKKRSETEPVLSTSDAAAERRMNNDKWRFLLMKGRMSKSSLAQS